MSNKPLNFSTGPCSACGDGDTELHYHSHSDTPTEQVPERIWIDGVDVKKVAARRVGSFYLTASDDGGDESHEYIRLAAVVEMVEKLRDAGWVAAAEKMLELIKE